MSAFGPERTLTVYWLDAGTRLRNSGHQAYFGQCPVNEIAQFVQRFHEGRPSRPARCECPTLNRRERLQRDVDQTSLFVGELSHTLMKACGLVEEGVLPFVSVRSHRISDRACSLLSV